MDKKEFAESQLRRNGIYQEKHDKLKALYVQYLDTGALETMDELIVMVMQLHTGWAYGQFRNPEYAKDLIVIGATKVYEGLQKKQDDPTQKPVDPEKISGYVHRVYENTRKDMLKKINRERQRAEDDDLLPEKRLPISLGELAETLERAYIESGWWKPVTCDDPFDILCRREKARVCHEFLAAYCRILMLLQNVPIQRALSLYFARVIPHQLDAISEKRQTSPQWAWQVMHNHTLGCLTKYSEEKIRQYLSPQLAWCDAYVSQLQMPCEGMVPQRRLQEVLAQEVMTETNVSHWSSELHTRLHKETIRWLRTQPDFVKLAREYIENDPIMGAVLQGGKER
jgi:hypothetical protein